MQHVLLYALSIQSFDSHFPLYVPKALHDLYALLWYIQLIVRFGIPFLTILSATFSLNDSFYYFLIQSDKL